MWLAAGASVVGLDPTQVIIAIAGLLGIVVTAATGVAVAIINSRPKVPSTTTPPVLDSDDWAYLRERVAKCEARISDLTDIAEISDRRHDQVERHLDLDNVVWRHNGGRGRP